jgi:NADH-quinone oxidoreductase subunit E
MSVRRLAQDQLQPRGFAFNKATAIIPLLMLAQDQEGWVSKPAIEHVADMLTMPYIRALEVATFYTQFQLGPVGTRAHVQVCGTTPCMLRGAEALREVCQYKIHHDAFHLNEAGTLSWEEVECQGACVNAPMVMIGHDTYEDLTPERLAEIIDAFEAGKGASVTPGPQIDRIFSAPEGGPLTLTGKPEPKAAKPKAPVAKKAEPKTVAPKAAPAVKPAAVAAPVLADKNRPAGIAKPSTVDDLKLISGVGPKIEATLQSLGIFTFTQVAAWKKAEREWVDGYLKFSGRIERDDWQKQAKALAKSGVAEYIKVFGKKPR